MSYKITQNGKPVHQHIKSEQSAIDILAGIAGHRRRMKKETIQMSSNNMKFTSFKNGAKIDVFEIANQD